VSSTRPRNQRSWATNRQPRPSGRSSPAWWRERSPTPCPAWLCNVDLTPTLLEVAGIRHQEDLDGVSFLPLLPGEETSVRDHFFCQLTWHDRYAPMRGIRTDRWKYIRHFGRRSRLYLPADVEESPSGREFRRREPARALPYEELYDLHQDPHELTDLGNDDRFGGVRVELSERLAGWMRESGDPLPDRHEEWLKRVDEERL
jgi:N-sulfoglucosamine sulfohydrolase